MQPAATAFGQALDAAALRDAEIDVVLNVTAQPARSAGELREELAVQLAARVRWTDSLRALSALGCDRFIEVGPGSVLAGMVKRTLPDARVASFGALTDLPKVAAILES
jgi:[acyl-carrier-protein] S-malonyltransferase